MAISLNPTQVLAQRAQMEALGANRTQQGVDNMYKTAAMIGGGLGKAAGGVMDYYDRKQVLDQFAQPEQPEVNLDRLTQIGIETPEQVDFVEQYATAIGNSKDPREIAYLTEEFAIRGNEMGLKEAPMKEIMQIGKLNPQAAQQAIVSTAQLMQNPNFRRLLARSPEKAAALQKVIAPEQEGMADIYKTMFEKDLSEKIDKRKEERGLASAEVKSIKQVAYDTMRGYKLVDNLINKAKTTNDPSGRAINASAVVAIARMVSPEAVQEADVKRLSGAGDVYQTALQVFSGEPEVLDAITRSLDPINKKYFNIDGLRDVADSAMGATYDSLTNRFEDAKSRAVTSGMPEDDINTNFGEIKSLSEMKSKLKPKKPEGFDLLAPEEQSELMQYYGVTEW